MKAIHADPKELRKIFAEKYVIPDFQRPYSWDIEHCDKLWEDFVEFYENQNSKEEKYFLGNIVIHPAGDAYSVIDGQQRLTTLILLIKSLHSKAGTAYVLEECLKIKDPLTSKLTSDLRIDSQVLEDDKKNLYHIIFDDGDKTAECNLKSNYFHLGAKINDWWKMQSNSAVELNNLILCLLDQVVMLPIHCGSEDDALTIFETINNRGMSLTDADIFKAKLHSAAKDEKDLFVQQWKELNNHEWLFRILMHIERAKEKDNTKEIALRSYFTSVKKNRLADWKDVMRCLKMIDHIEISWGPTNKINILWRILYTYPNYYWNFPLYVYLHKYGSLEDEEFILPEDRYDDFHRLLENTVKYIYVKGVVYNSVNAIKDTIYRVCVRIEEEGDYLAEYAKNISSNDMEEFFRKLENQQYGRYLKGLVLIAAYLNPNQNQDDFDEFMGSTYHLEHILPKKWNNYDGWNESTWEQDLDALGNLIPLEYRLNISAKNEFFSRKRECYDKSKVQDARDLMEFDEWTPEHLLQQQSEKMDRLRAYFNITT